jgi:hypothetical protein
MVKPSDLPKIWSAPDNTRLTAKQFSYRHPVAVAAKLMALCELYPTKSRTDIVNDLLATALSDVERSLPSVCGIPADQVDPETREELYEDVGPKARFRGLANKAYLELEEELGNKDAEPLYRGGFVCARSDEE